MNFYRFYEARAKRWSFFFVCDWFICIQKNGRSMPNTNSMPNATINEAQENENVVIGADDSDYYTPEDPHTTILSPLCPEKVWKR